MDIQTFRQIPYKLSLTFLAYMPFHVFLVQSLSLATGGLDIWKASKDVALGLATVFVVCLVYQQRKASRLFGLLVGLALLYGGLHLLLWALHPDLYRPTAILGFVYNTRVLCFAVLGMGASLLLSNGPYMRAVLRWTLAVSTLVAILGVIQYFLPKDFLTHLGYSLERGVRPAFFIDDQPDLPRIMSTLRDPNSLGAYLVLPITALSVLLLHAKDIYKRQMLGGMLAVHGLALLLTFSRSAWAGALLAVGLVLWWQYRESVLAAAKRFWVPGAILLVLLGGTLFAARNAYVVKSFVTHSDGTPQAQYDSNGFHWYYAKKGIDGIVRNPFGHGPGTAGLVSIQNPNGGLLTENYYIQIGYEVGLLGLALFIAVNVLLYLKLRQRHDDIGTVLLASFWAYVLINMLLHIWSNEAVAAQWWILAGLAAGVKNGHTKDY
ncbi:MAG TPA: O-antigen ligase family protein [Nevskiaceae bacterium]|nr:O-antigen ligase family protein [Nevskiaceae bacterium]